MKCEYHPCDQPAHAHCSWASDKLPLQKANLCRAHANELWEMIRPLLKSNLAWITIDNPEPDKSGRNET